MEHSPIPPSSAAIWGAPNGCTGWHKMASQYPELEKSESAKEGDACHELAAKMINHPELLGPRSKADVIGTTATNGMVVSPGMVEGADLYARDVLETIAGKLGSLEVEKKIQAPRIHPISFGTSDCFFYDQNTRELFLWDFKFGFKPVEVFQNWQAINYVAGILDSLGLTPDEENGISVKIRIVQPRAPHRDGPVREWSVTVPELLPLFETLHENAALTFTDRAQIQSGKHCEYCTARHACPAALTAGVGLYEVATTPLPVELSVDALSFQFAIIQRAKEQISFLETGFEEQIKSLLRQGTQVPGYALEPTFGRLQWSKPISEVIGLGKLLGIDLEKPTAITPKQAEELGLAPSLVKEFSETLRTGVKIVSNTDTKAKEIFSK